MTTLKGSLVTLKTPVGKDWEGWLYPYNDLETMKILIPYFKKEVWTVEEIRERYEKRGEPFSVIRNSDGKTVGVLELSDIKKGDKAQMGLILHREVWRTGISLECRLLGFEYGFKKLNLKAIYLYTDPLNKRAQAHYKKVGIPFLETTKLGLTYQVELEHWSKIEAKLRRLLQKKA